MMKINYFLFLISIGAVYSQICLHHPTVYVGANASCTVNPANVDNGNTIYECDDFLNCNVASATCQYPQWGGACTYDSDCTPPVYCLSGTCKLPAWITDACTTDSDCWSNNCVSSKCAALSLGDSCSGTSVQFCPPGSYCSGVCRQFVAPGGDCSSALSLCTDGYTCSSTNICIQLNSLANGQPCDQSIQCQGRCDFSSNQCASLSAAGGVCNSADECSASLWCDGATYLASGVCSSNATCDNSVPQKCGNNKGYCDCTSNTAGVCTVTPANPADACQSENDNLLTCLANNCGDSNFKSDQQTYFLVNPSSCERQKCMNEANTYFCCEQGASTRSTFTQLPFVTCAASTTTMLGSTMLILVAVLLFSIAV